MTLEHDLLQQAMGAIRTLMNGRNFATGQTGHYLNIILRIEDELSRTKPEQVITPISPDQYERLCFTCGACTGKPWVGLTSEDWENTPDTGKKGCERDAELCDWIEQTLKDKNT